MIYDSPEETITMFFKYFILFVLAVYVTAAPNFETKFDDENKSHDLIVGYRVPGDWLLEKDDVLREKQFLQVVTLTKTFTGNGKSVITQIKALDQKTNGNGAYATVISGGVDQSYVTIKFKSQRNHGIRFKVEIYGQNQ
ncbi:probable salivary secreted peptide [Belonocnema kinseyi]|uniref:probable salivary secreted peptide n=1 Tax=Belonocnema kinseyi TaxID=2817044 RepID=UPI00143DE191|nr:probable salivary secreted peptide [Belonocnema kinseyi]